VLFQWVSSIHPVITMEMIERHKGKNGPSFHISQLFLGRVAQVRLKRTMICHTRFHLFVWTLKDLLCLRKSWSDGPIACSIVPDLPSLGSSCNHGGMAPTTVIKTYSPTYTDNNTVTNRRSSIVLIFNYLCEHFHCWKNPAIQKEIILVKYFIIWQVTYSWRENSCHDWRATCQRTW
jgi:hypothetical protein